ncbi:MAG: siphovirus Gp157 family protein [Candidatus Hodarchaeales archaeon]
MELIQLQQQINEQFSSDQINEGDISVDELAAMTHDALVKKLNNTLAFIDQQQLNIISVEEKIAKMQASKKAIERNIQYFKDVIKFYMEQNEEKTIELEYNKLTYSEPSSYKIVLTEEEELVASKMLSNPELQQFVRVVHKVDKKGLRDFIAETGVQVEGVSVTKTEPTVRGFTTKNKLLKKMNEDE